jgi:hypothetical protein
MDNVIVGARKAESSGSLAAHGQLEDLNTGEISYDHIKVSSSRSWSLILP